MGSLGRSDTRESEFDGRREGGYGVDTSAEVEIEVPRLRVQRNRWFDERLLADEGVTGRPEVRGRGIAGMNVSSGTITVLSSASTTLGPCQCQTTRPPGFAVRLLRTSASCVSGAGGSDPCCSGVPANRRPEDRTWETEEEGTPTPDVWTLRNGQGPVTARRPTLLDKLRLLVPVTSETKISRRQSENMKEMQLPTTSGRIAVRRRTEPLSAPRLRQGHNPRPSDLSSDRTVTVRPGPRMYLFLFESTLFALQEVTPTGRYFWTFLCACPLRLLRRVLGSL